MTSEEISMISAGVALFSAGAAWGAIYINRLNAKEAIRAQINTGARTSRAAVVSANRQKWIDAVRDDLAEFISVIKQLQILERAGSMERAGQDALLAEERQLETKLIMLRARVEMRLNPKEEDHEELLKLMDRYYEKPTTVIDLALRTKGRNIFKAEWSRLKKEASGIDPFVREAVPDRK